MDLTRFLEGEALRSKHIEKIFFYRICGTGMGACACLAQEAGYKVAGADLSFSPPMSTYLEESGIETYPLDEITAEKLQEYDLIIVGNSVPRVSRYAEQIESAGVSFTSFPAFLGEFILKSKEVIGVAGTHGKTTTTFFLTQMLETMRLDPGYFIGGIIEGRPPSKLGSNYFPIESDEYDSAYFQKISKFRLYELNHMILTSLEFDHADIFGSIEDIKKEFRAILPDFPGKIIANDAYPAIHELKEEFSDKEWIFYGEQSDVGPKNINISNKVSTFELELDGEKVLFESNVIGTHNILNLSACVLLMHSLGQTKESLQAAVKTLGLVKRRQEERGHYKGSLVIDDFAHHPKAIKLTLEALKQKYPERSILTVFEPISATARSSIFQKEFAESLENSDQVIMAMNPLPTTVKGTENLSGDQIVSHLSSKNIQAVKVNELAQLRAEIDARVKDDTLLVILSNRTCLGLWESDFVQALS